jgi:hypothetical protein
MTCRCRNFCLSLFVGWLPVVAAVAQAPAETPPGGPRLQLSTQEWNFGVVWQGQSLKEDVTVKNVGDAPLEILDIITSCGCTMPTKPKSPLAPGESDVMTLSYHTGQRVGGAHQTVTLKTNDPTQPSVVIKLVGDIKPVYELEPRDGLVFGQLYRNSGETRRVTITNRYKDPLLLALKPDQDFGPFHVELKVLELGQRYELSATTRPPLSVGRHQAYVAMETGVEVLPEIKSIIYAFVQPPVTVRPAKLFWPRSYPTEMKRVLLVSHAPDHPVEVTGARATVDAIKVEVERALPSGDKAASPTYKINVTIPPGDRVPADADLAIEIMTNSSEPECRKLVVPIQVITGASAGEPHPPGAIQRPPAAPSENTPTTRPARTPES